MRRPTLHSLKRFRRYDVDERDPRLSDRMDSWGLRIALALILLMTLWVHRISDDVTTSQRSIRQEQLSLNAQKVQLGTQNQSLIEGCQRLNQVRRSDNNAHLGAFTLFQFILAAQATTAQKQAEAAQHLTAAQKALFAEEIAHIKSTTAAQSWTPLTNCRQTVAQHGVNYKLPPPISFTTRMPPPAALSSPKPKTTVRP